MKKIMTVIAIFLAFIGTAFAAVDIAIEELEATQDAQAYDAIELAFNIKNVGDEPAALGLSVQLFTPDNLQGLGIYNLLLLSKMSNEQITQVTVYKTDGTTRIEEIQERWMNGTEIRNGVENTFTQPVDSIFLFPGEYITIKDAFTFRDAALTISGEHQIGLRFVGIGSVYAGGVTTMKDRTGKTVTIEKPETTLFLGQTPEATFENNEMLTTVVVKKRVPLVEEGPMQISDDFELEENQYFIHNYQEYYENGKLCANVAENEICHLENFDGENYPFTINGQQEKLDWKAKLFYTYIAGDSENDDEKSKLYQFLADFIHVETDGITVYLTGAPGWIVAIEE